MTPETHVLVKADHITDVALHDEIKCRAYELYDQRDTVDGHDPKEGCRPNCLAWSTRQPSFRSTPRAR